MIWRTVCLGLACVVAGCATTPSPEDSSQPEPSSDAPKAASASDPVTVTIDRQPLGTAVRTVADATSLGIIVMNGLENRTVGPMEFTNAPVTEIAEALAAEADCTFAERNYALFFYPQSETQRQNYATLNDVSLGDRLASEYDGVEADVAFSAGTPLFDIFAVMGQSLDMTLIADNAIAGTLSGEIALDGVTLRHALEGILKSARIHQRAFGLRSTDEYIFLYSARNPPREDIFANRDAYSTMPAALERRVDVTLPRPSPSPKTFPAYEGGTHLGVVAESLSNQLGVPVHVEQGLEEIPVNPSVMRGVQVRTAIELMIHQWLLPEFGYEYHDDGIHIRHIGPPNSSAAD